MKLVLVFAVGALAAGAPLLAVGCSNIPGAVHIPNCPPECDGGDGGDATEPTDSTVSSGPSEAGPEAATDAGGDASAD